MLAVEWHVTLSGIDREGELAMDTLRRGNSDAVHVGRRWKPLVTHVVAACTPQRLAKRTLK